LLPEANPDRSFFGAWVKTHAEVVPGVWVVAGPALGSAPPPAPPPRPIDAAPVAWSAVALLALAWVAGSGWAVAATRRDTWFSALALAPAIGVAVIVAAGVIADRAGIRLGSGGGLAAVVVAASAGWVLAAAAGKLAATPQGGPAGRHAEREDAEGEDPGRQ